MEIKELIDYDMVDGSFFILKNNVRYRKIFANEDGYLIFYRNGKRIKFKANKLVFKLVNNIDAVKDKVTLHKNLDETDFRYCNLVLISNKTYNIIKEAHKNLSGYLKIKPHPKDMFSYLLIWKEDSKNRTLVVQDVVMVKRAYNKLQLKYAKILNKYCVFD